MVINVGAMLAAACSTVLAGSFALPIEDRQKDRMAERKLLDGALAAQGPTKRSHGLTLAATGPEAKMATESMSWESMRMNWFTGKRWSDRCA
jgi:hypothetical protein